MKVASEEKNIIEQIKAVIFKEVVLAIITIIVLILSIVYSKN